MPDPKKPPKTYNTPHRADAGAGRTFTPQKRSARPFELDAELADEVWAFMCRVLRNGDNASFTLTSDGGAITITILASPLKHRAFAKNGDELLEVMAQMLTELYD